MSRESRRAEGFDGAAAVTRSLLGYGVVAGAFYLGVGIVLALTRDGFELSRHALSLLMLGDHGWMQRANLILAGLMSIAAAVGFARAMSGSRSSWRAGALVAIYGTCLVLSGIFPPDPMGGFPPGVAQATEPSVAGLLHLAFGAVGFLSLAAAAFVVGGWFADRDLVSWARYSRAGALVVILGFMGGAALSTQVVGVVVLWIAVVTGWAWLAGASLILYRVVPHPDAHRSEASAA